MKSFLESIMLKSIVARNKSRRFFRYKKNFIVLTILCVLCVFLGIFAGSIYGYINTTTPITIEQLKNVKLTSTLFDSKGHEIIKLKNNENREWIGIDSIPQKLQYAFIAIEDRRFLQHGGVDYWGFVRAMFDKIFNPNSRTEGASTITMQVVKNLTNEKDLTLSRKIQELTRALQLEKNLGKKDILELYLNLIYLGNGNYGIKTAAKDYFGKDDLNALSTAECACLASITQTPSRYAPISDTSRRENMDKQKTVLKYMQEENFISEDEYTSAVSEKVTFIAPDLNKNKKVSQNYFVDNVINEIVSDYMKRNTPGVTEQTIKDEIYNHGWQIYTTMDPQIQKAMDEVYLDSKYFPFHNKQISKDKSATYQIESGMVIINPQNGEIVAMYGGNGAKTADLAFNHAIQLNRNPGSSFKPIAVYGPGLDMNTLNPFTVIDDSECFLDPKHPKTPYPKNYDNTHKGNMFLKDGLATSNNVVAAKAWNMINKQEAFNYLKKSGIDAKFMDGVSVALGGAIGVSPLKMAAAYVPFVKKGLYVTPISYTKIVDHNGTVLIDKRNDANYQQTTVVYKEETCTTMTNMMEAVFSQSGTAPYVKIHNSKGQTIAAAGKTGTTDDDTDRWLVGFTPYYVGAVWFGDKNNTPLPRIDPNPAANIWLAVMNKVHANAKPASFPHSSVMDQFHLDPNITNGWNNWWNNLFNNNQNNNQNNDPNNNQNNNHNNNRPTNTPGQKTPEPLNQ